MRRTALAGLTFVLLVGPTQPRLGAAAPQYTVEDLGSIDGVVPVVTGMNAAGQISGYANTNLGARAVRYTPGSGWAYVHGLESVFSVAWGINSNGDLAGYHQAADGTRAFRYLQSSDSIQVIGTLDTGTMSVGFAINDAGDVVGVGDTAAGNRSWRSSVGLPPVALPTLGGAFAQACGINNTGQISGMAATPDGVSHAFRIEANGTITDVGSFDGALGTSAGCGINADGVVVGYSSASSSFHAFRYGSSLLDLDTFGSPNSKGEAISGGTTVGWFFSAADSTLHAFVHTDANGSIDLNSRIPAGSGWLLNRALAVNTTGVIAGEGTFNGATRLFRLTPSDTTPPTITALQATPSSIAPPNNAMVGVSITAVATDDVDPNPVCSLTSISSAGAPASDYSITGSLSGSVRAVGGRTYRFNVSCADASGNHTEGFVDVPVPPDTTAPSITSLSVTPSLIWPANGKMDLVTVDVSATDDVDAAPVCAITSITANEGAPSDAVILTAFTADVRATRNSDGGVRVYSLHVTCGDTAGNTSEGVADVWVNKDHGGKVFGPTHRLAVRAWRRRR